MRSMSPSRTRMLLRILLMFLDSRFANMSTYSSPIRPPITRSRRWSSATLVTMLQSYLKYRKTTVIPLFTSLTVTQ